MRHPEQTEDEIYFVNINSEKIHQIGWESKRVVTPAYDKYGREVPGLVAVLVDRKEAIESGQSSLMDLFE